MKSLQNKMTLRSAVKNDWIHWANMQKISNIVYFNLSGYRFRMLHLNIKVGEELPDISSMGRSDEVVMSKVFQSCEGFWGCLFLGGSCWAIAQTGSATQIPKADFLIATSNRNAYRVSYCTIQTTWIDGFFRGAFQILQAFLFAAA